MACDGALLAAAALAAAGTGATIAGQQQAKSAMNRKTMEELLRQRGIQDKASKEFAASLAGSEKPVADTQMQEGQEQRETGYRQVQGVPLTAGNEQLIGGNSAAINLQDQAQLAASNRSRSKLGSYDKWQLDQAVKNLRAGQMQGVYGQQAQRSQAVLPMELQDASHKGDTLAGIGAGLGLLSTIMSLGSTAGLGAGTTATTTAGTTAANAAPVAGYGWANAANTGAGLASGYYGMQRKY